MLKVGFHSYKGGTGRTRALVGTGAILASRGYRVALLDFDVDASGLTTIFGGDPEQIGRRELLTFLNEGAATFHQVQDALIDITDSYLKERFRVDDDDESTALKYLPTITDPRRSDGINLTNLSDLVDELLQFIGDHPFDYILVDIKPGYSPSFRALAPLLDHLVFVSRIDRENIAGIERLAQDVRSTGVTCHLVANMVPEHDRSAGRLKKLAAAANVSEAIRIGYHPDLVFDHTLSILRDRNSEFSKRLNSLADNLTGQD